jgi:hypothetical protein
VSGGGAGSGGSDGARRVVCGDWSGVEGARRAVEGMRSGCSGTRSRTACGRIRTRRGVRSRTMCGEWSGERMENGVEEAGEVGRENRSNIRRRSGGGSG